MERPPVQAAASALSVPSVASISISPSPSSSHLNAPPAAPLPPDISWRQSVRLEDEDALASPVSVRDGETLQVIGPHGFYFPPDSNLLSRFVHLFPDTKSRLLAALGVLAALAYLIAWMVETIRGRWIGQRYTPVTTLSFESVAQLPAAHGLLAFFHMDTWWNNSLADSVDLTYYNESTLPINTPYPTYHVPAPVPPHRYVWQEFYLLGRLDESTGQDIEAVYSCVPSANPALSIAPVSWCTAKNYPTYVETRADWPLQFQSTLSRFCVRSYALFDERATVSLIIGQDGYEINFNSYEYDLPQYKFSVMSLESMYRFYLMEMSGQDISSPTLAGLYADPVMLPYQHRHGVSVRMRKTLKLDGSVQWTSDIGYDNSRQFKEADVAKAWEDFYERNDDILTELRHDPNIELNTTLGNFTRQYFAETCISPSSFTIQLVTESTPYGLAAFLGDLGGTLNFLALVLGLLFPLANSLIQPRTFLGVTLVERWRRYWKTTPTTPTITTTNQSDQDHNADTAGAEQRSHSSGADSKRHWEMRMRAETFKINEPNTAANGTSDAAAN